MKISKGWKLVPVEPTPEMSAFENTGVHFPIADRIYGAMLSAAPTPPAQEDEPVKPIGHKSQYADHYKPDRWYDCPDDDLPVYAERGDKTRVLYVYANQPILYTHPQSDELRKAAEEAVVMIMDLFGDYGNLDFQEKMDNLRAALRGKL